MDWERLWAPYDEPTYQAVLAEVGKNDIVLEIGAGDLRLARRLAERARRVYAIEVQAHLIEAAQRRAPLPENLTLIVGDAREVPFPAGITAGVLLMRHCTQFRLYVEKLMAVGCRRLLTNARWRLGVEVIDLMADRIPFAAVTLGWYACLCGATGFVPGPAEHLRPALEAIVHEVIACPACRGSKGLALEAAQSLPLGLPDAGG